MTQGPMLGWHFMPENMCLDYKDGRQVEIGKWYKMKRRNSFPFSSSKPEVCFQGMHMCPDLREVLTYTYRGPMLCRVEVKGRLDQADGKVAGEKRKVLWYVDSRPVFKKFLEWAVNQPNNFLKNFYFCSPYDIKNEIETALAGGDSQSTCVYALIRNYTTKQSAPIFLKKLEEMIFEEAGVKE